MILTQRVKLACTYPLMPHHTVTTTAQQQHNSRFVPGLQATNLLELAVQQRLQLLHLSGIVIAGRHALGAAKKCRRVEI